MSQSVTIKATADGPYIVKGLKNFSNQKGSIECEATVALCRCGQSANKPYCDGTHSKIGFKSDNQLDAGKDQVDHYRGKKITIHDNRSICAHAGYCTDGLPAVFRMREEPFVDPHGATLAEIVEVVNRCPSGALSYTLEDDDGGDEVGEASIFIAPNGPYVVKGRVELVDTSRAQGASESTCTLCRCGASKNKPFCDGSHWNIEFSDDAN